MLLRSFFYVKQHIAYKVTTMRKHSHSVADNIVNQQFNPKQANQVWAGDVTYLRTGKAGCFWRLWWIYIPITSLAGQFISV